MTRFFATLLCLAAITTLAISISACGYRGPLYLPGEETDQTVDETTSESEETDEEKSGN